MIPWDAKHSFESTGLDLEDCEKDGKGQGSSPMMIELGVASSSNRRKEHSVVHRLQSHMNSRLKYRELRVPPYAWQHLGLRRLLCYNLHAEYEIHSIAVWFQKFERIRLSIHELNQLLDSPRGRYVGLVRAHMR